MDDKQEILQALRAEFNRWEALLAGMNEAQITDPQLPGGLSLKDVIAHLWAWQQRSIARMDAALHNHEPEFPKWPETLVAEADDVDQVNDWILRTNRDKSWAQVYAEWRAGFLRFVELTEAIPEQELLQPGRYAWLGEHPLALIPRSSYEHHHEEHLGPLLDWLRRK